MSVLTLTLTVPVYGTPAPQGSKRHVGRGILIESSKAVAPWRQAVKWAVLTHNPDGLRWAAGTPVRVDIVFTVAKPVSAPKRRRTWPAKRPDLDKLIRSTLDGICESGVIADDAQVVELTAAKRYPFEGECALPTPGAWIRISPPALTDEVAGSPVAGVRQEWVEIL